MGSLLKGYYRLHMRSLGHSSYDRPVHLKDRETCLGPSDGVLRTFWRPAGPRGVVPTLILRRYDKGNLDTISKGISSIEKLASSRNVAR